MSYSAERRRRCFERGSKHWDGKRGRKKEREFIGYARFIGKKEMKFDPSFILLRSKNLLVALNKLILSDTILYIPYTC